MSQAGFRTPAAEGAACSGDGFGDGVPDSSHGCRGLGPRKVGEVKQDGKAEVFALSAPFLHQRPLQRRRRASVDF
jgi:hypothetical protein